MPALLVDRFVASPCCNPEMDLDTVLAAYSRIGFRKFEAFTSWCRSALDINGEPATCLAAARRHGMRFASIHLPPITDDLDASLATAVQAAEFAKAVGAGVVLFKANSRPNYIRCAKPFLDAVEELGLTPVIQNHVGTPLTTLDDVREVIDGICDPRMKSLLEVGHFHSAGVTWQQGVELLGDRIALVHIKDQVGKQSVPFGQGEIDLPGLLRHMHGRGYRGDYVVEMEVADRENTLLYLEQALEFLGNRCREYLS